MSRKFCIFLISRMLILLIFILLVGTLGELILRGIGFETFFTEPHPLLGHFHIPNAHTCINRAEYKNCIKINSYGLRDKEINKEKKEKVYRIGFFGDSFVEAVQVPEEKTFVSLIEKNLNKEYGFPVHSKLLTLESKDIRCRTILFFISC